MEKFMKSWLGLVVFLLLVSGYAAEQSRLPRRALQQQSDPASVLPGAAAGNDTTALNTSSAATAAAAQPKATYACYHYTPKELEIIAAGQNEADVCLNHGFWFDYSGAGSSSGCGSCKCCARSGAALSWRRYYGCHYHDFSCSPWFPPSLTRSCLATKSDMTVEKCAQIAALKGYAMMGVQGRHCYGFPGTVIFPLEPADTSLCSINCPGDAAVKCGYITASMYPDFPRPRPHGRKAMISLYSTDNAEAYTGSPPNMQRLDVPYVGCFREPVEGDVRDRLMTILAEDNAMTIDKCIDLARARGYKYMAVQSNNQCFGSNDVKQYIDRVPSLAAPSCDRECAGNRYQICGGAWANSIYYVGNGPSGPPNPSNKCLGVSCPTPPECQAGGGCNPADGTCYPFTNVMNGLSCSSGGLCQNGRCEHDVCAGVYCPDPPECKTGGRCNPYSGQCDPFRNGPNGATCSGGGACLDGECQLTTGIQDLTFVTGSSSCPSGYSKLPQDLNEGLIPTYATTSIFACVKRTSDPAKMLHSLRFVDNPSVTGDWCRTLYETRLPQNLNPGSTGYRQLMDVYACVEYPSDNPQIPWLVLDLTFVKRDVLNCPAGFNMNGGVDLNGLRYLNSPLPIYSCIKLLM